MVETNTNDEVTPEEIHRMREEIKAHLKNGSISQEQYRKWRPVRPAANACYRTSLKAVALLTAVENELQRFVISPV